MSETSKENEPSGGVDKQLADELVQSPFDRLLNRALTHKESAQELIRSHLPSELVKYFKLETIERADTSFIDANLKRRFADRLFTLEMDQEISRKVCSETGQVQLLILVDHKSSPDKYTVVQLLGYIIRILEDRIENGLPLIPIFPWVIYNGVRPDWKLKR